MVKFNKIDDIIADSSDEIIDFLRELIKIPSPSCREREVANAIASKMRDLQYDAVKIDKFGNVIGLIKGSGKGASILFNGHMDTVPPGEMKEPFSGKIMSGDEFGVKGKVIYGRGACDMKGALAASVYAGAILKKSDMKIPGDIYVTGVVMEELAMMSFGSRHLVTSNGLKSDIAVIGESTSLDITTGHRGIVYPEITTFGKSCHASDPTRGTNALYKMARIIKEIQKLIPRLPKHPFLGKTTMSVNTISVVPGALNVVPDKCTISVDVRNIPELRTNQIILMLKRIIEDMAKKDAEFKAEVKLIEKKETSYTGYSEKLQRIVLPFYIDPAEPHIKVAIDAVKQVLGRRPKVKPWSFATDASCFANSGAVTFGFGPGEERFAHSSSEHVKIEDVIAATKVYARLPIMENMNLIPE